MKLHTRDGASTLHHVELTFVWQAIYILDRQREPISCQKKNSDYNWSGRVKILGIFVLEYFYFLTNFRKL